MGTRTLRTPMTSAKRERCRNPLRGKCPPSKRSFLRFAQAHPRSLACLAAREGAKIEVEEAQIQMMCSRSRPWLATLTALLGLSLAGCAGQGFMGLGGSQPEPAVAAV